MDGWMGGWFAKGLGFGVALVLATGALADQEPSSPLDLEAKAVLRGTIDDRVHARLTEVGGRVVSATRGVGVLMVRAPLRGLLELAKLKQVQSIRLRVGSARERERLLATLRQLEKSAEADPADAISALSQISALGGMGDLFPDHPGGPLHVGRAHH